MYLLFTWDEDELPDYTPADHLLGSYLTTEDCLDALDECDRDFYQCIDATTGKEVSLFGEPEAVR